MAQLYTVLWSCILHRLFAPAKSMEQCHLTEEPVNLETSERLAHRSDRLHELSQFALVTVDMTEADPWR